MKPQLRRIGQDYYDCDACDEQVKGGWAIEVGQKPDWESRTALLCPSCVRDVVRLAETMDLRVDV